MDHRWMIHPSKKNQRIAARQNWTIAISNRPWSNWPRPGTKKLQSAARTLPAEPWPAMLRRYKQMQNQQAHFVEIRRISHISLNFPCNLRAKIASFSGAPTVDSEKPECYRR